MPRFSQDEDFQAFLDEASAHPILGAVEERRLSRAARGGDGRARQRLIECNFRLALSISMAYRNRGLDLPDLIQEGVIGLHTAADKFDPDRGVKFSTYATWWVRKSIQQGIAASGSGTIRLPPGVRQRRGRAMAILRENPSWDLARVAKDMGEDETLIREALDAAEVVASMDGPWETSDEDDGLSDRIADPNASNPYDQVRDGTAPGLAAAVALLPEPERSVVELRFGLRGGNPATIAEIAAKLKKPDHFVQSAQRRGLAKLREVVDHPDG